MSYARTIGRILVVGLAVLAVGGCRSRDYVAHPPR